MSNRALRAIACLIAITITGAIASGVWSVRRDSRTVAGPVLSNALWTAAAPGVVEPKGGFVPVSTQVAGVILEVAAAMGQDVKHGDLLVRLKADDTAARLEALHTELAVRLLDRDLGEVRGAAQERRSAGDSLFAAREREGEAQSALDTSLRALRDGTVTPDEVHKARETLRNAKTHMQDQLASMRKVQSGVRSPVTRGDAAVTELRAQIAALNAEVERTRVRAPIDGTVFKIKAKVGEMAAPSTPLAVLGTAGLSQVRAEVDERDAENVRQGQAARISAAAFPGRDFEAKVTSVAQMLDAPQLTSRNARKMTDIDVLEVILDLEKGTPILPGSRVDVFFEASGRKNDPLPGVASR